MLLRFALLLCLFAQVGTAHAESCADAVTVLLQKKSADAFNKRNQLNPKQLIGNPHPESNESIEARARALKDSGLVSPPHEIDGMTRDILGITALWGTDVAVRPTNGVLAGHYGELCFAEAVQRSGKRLFIPIQHERGSSHADFVFNGDSVVELKSLSVDRKNQLEFVDIGNEHGVITVEPETKNPEGARKNWDGFLQKPIEDAMTMIVRQTRATRMELDRQNPKLEYPMGFGVIQTKLDGITPPEYSHQELAKFLMRRLSDRMVELFETVANAHELDGVIVHVAFYDKTFSFSFVPERNGVSERVKERAQELLEIAKNL